MRIIRKHNKRLEQTRLERGFFDKLRGRADEVQRWPYLAESMINLISSVIALLVLLWLQASLAVANTDPQLLKEPDEIVDVCELKKDPSRFAGKSFRLRAVLVENRTPRVDGGDSYLYGPRCRKSSLSIVVHFLSEEGYQLIGVLKPDHSGYVRANVVLLGVFNYSENRKFGHLDWAGSQFVVKKVIEAHRTPANMRWPS